MQHIAPEFEYGTVVLYEENGVIVPAHVLQAQKVGYADPTQPTGINSREELMLLFLDPNAGETIMAQADVQNAIKQRFGVREKTATQANGFIRCTIAPIASPVAEVPAPAEEAETPVPPPVVSAKEWDSWTPEAKDAYLKEHPGLVINDEEQAVA